MTQKNKNLRAVAFHPVHNCRSSSSTSTTFPDSNSVAAAISLPSTHRSGESSPSQVKFYKDGNHLHVCFLSLSLFFFFWVYKFNSQDWSCCLGMVLWSGIVAKSAIFFLVFAYFWIVEVWKVSSLVILGSDANCMFELLGMAEFHQVQAFSLFRCWIVWTSFDVELYGQLDVVSCFFIECWKGRILRCVRVMWFFCIDYVGDDGCT